MRQNDRVMGGLRTTVHELQDLVNYVECCERLSDSDFEFCQNKISAVRRQLKSWQQLLVQQRPAVGRMLPWRWN